MTSYPRDRYCSLCKGSFYTDDEDDPYICVTCRESEALKKAKESSFKERNDHQHQILINYYGGFGKYLECNNIGAV